ncbi:ComE operon protein 2 [Yersinia frederiksenii]|nr:ComE operon protein 2 [Yersinia frederiksenii]CNJ00165.1 ComE operon protein 2 [Yersinia frederiksenii]
MAEPVKKMIKELPIAANNNAVDSDATSSIEKIKERRSQELIVGICGAVGSGVKRLKDSLKTQLKKSGYIVEHIRLSDLIAELETNADEIKALKGFVRYDTLQNLGDKLRSDHQNSHSIVAEMAIRRITTLRTARFGQKVPEGKKVKTTEKVAYIIDQLKHPDEVKLFKTTYRNNFYLVGMLRTIQERKQNLKEEGISEKQINILIERDRKSEDEFGQQVEDTLQLADYFVRNIDLAEQIKNSVDRFINLIHGASHITPTRDETGVFSAYSASFRSACLSRQVGSAIMDDDRNILATGCNDVPKFGGGLYTVDSLKDRRCFNRSGCYNDKHKRLLQDQIEKILAEAQVDDTVGIAEKIMKNTKAKSLIEYSRAIHAEMDAIVALARNTSVGTVNKTLYCTTYPCHNCARHIVAAGIKRVVYIEPYEKSLALELHDDAISHADSGSERDKVVFESFEGVAPARYSSFFKYNQKRKDETGKPISYDVNNSYHVDSSYLDSYISYEMKIVQEINKKVGEEVSPNFTDE